MVLLCPCPSGHDLTSNMDRYTERRNQIEQALNTTAVCGVSKYQLKPEDIRLILEKVAQKMNSIEFMDFIGLANDIRTKKVKAAHKNHLAGVEKRKGPRKPRLYNNDGHFIGAEYK